MYVLTTYTVIILHENSAKTLKTLYAQSTIKGTIRAGIINK